MARLKGGYEDILAAFDLGATQSRKNIIDLTSHFGTKTNPPTFTIGVEASNDDTYTLAM